MSTNIVRSANPAKGKLLRVLEEARQLVMPEFREDVSWESQCAQYEECARIIEEKIRKIELHITTLETIHDRWLAFLEKAPDAQRREEEQRYEEMTKDESGLLNIMEEAKEARITMMMMKEDLQRAMDRLRGSRETSRAETPQENQQGIQATRGEEMTKNQRSLTVKLPKLSLREFNGDPKCWREFWSGFESAVHNQNLPDVQKLNYLLTCLRGPALSAVQGYEVAPENYEIIREILKKKFGNPTIIKRSLYNELKMIKRNERGLKSIVESIERVLRQLVSLGENIEHPNVEMSIEEKLPTWVLNEIYQKKEAEAEWSVNKLRQCLGKIVERREEVNRIQSMQLTENKSIPMRSNWKRNTEARETSALAAIKQNNSSKFSGNEPYQRKNGEKSNIKARRPCAFCNKNHWNNHCSDYPTAEQRIVRLQEMRSCFNCLRPGHATRDCRSAKKQCFYCKQFHNTALCRVNKRNTTEKESTCNAVAEVEKDEEPATTNNAVTIAEPRQEKNVLLVCREVVVINPNDHKRRTKAVAFFDPGSQLSFVSTHLANQLNLKGNEEEVKIAVFGNRKPEKRQTLRVQIGIETKSKRIYKLDVNTMEHLTNRVQLVNIEDDEISKVAEEKQLPKTAGSWKHPDLLIGADYFFKFVEPNNSEELRSGFYLVRTELGPILAGAGYIKGGIKSSITQTEMVLVCTINNHSNADVDQFWKLELLGITESTHEKEDEMAMKQFQKSIRKEGGRYTVGWPWRYPDVVLPTNFGLCVGRLKSTVKKLNEHPGLLAKYDDIVKEQLKTGIIEEVKDYRESDGPVHYLPHQPVINMQKNTTKIRMVYDASAQTSLKKSLNDILYRGPVMLNNLIGILLRFRQMSIAIVCDIEKAYHQLALNKTDRDVTRFLWLRDYHKPVDRGNLTVYRFQRVPFGVVSSPFLLAAVIRHHLSSVESTIATKVEKNIYVDNAIIDADTSQEAIASYHEIKNIFHSACMNMREFRSNSDEFNNALPEEDLQTASQVKVLGIQWDTTMDELTITFPQATVQATKRHLLQGVASIYDPLGIIAPAILPAKVLIQTLWRKNYQWDDPLQPDERGVWERIAKEWNGTQITLPRKTSEKGSSKEIHVFTDASTVAYAAVIYLRSRKDDKCQCSIIFAKTRLTPIKGLTIPRCELMGVLIGVRALKFVTEQLDMGEAEKTIWSDSKCVLSWIRNQTKMQPRFVQNRLEEIRKIEAEFRYVATRDNPADIASRGMDIENLKKCALWWNGPPWLIGKKNEWPTTPIDVEANQEFDQEDVEETNQLVAATIDKDQEACGSLVDPMRFSKWNRLIRTTVQVLKFIHKTSKGKYLRNVLAQQEITTGDYVIAERILIKEAQKAEIPITERQKWNLFLDEEGIIRCKGRLNQSELPMDAIYPIYLPRQSRITWLIIQDAHEKHLHSGVSQTIAEVRRKFWVEKGRSTIKKILRGCMMCRRWCQKPFELPQFPAYPKERVQKTAVFEYVGFDYLGPVNIRMVGAKETTKRWIALFCCFSTRAVHLEVAADLSAEACLHVLRRFIARRGMPRIIISDNAPNFKSTTNVMEKAMKNNAFNPSVLNYCSQNGIQWKFITPLAPWQGGLYERLIGLTKRAFKRAVGRRLLNNEELVTLIDEIEAIINSRPLTQMAEDTIQVLRPMDFLIPLAKVGSPLGTKAIEEAAEKDETAQCGSKLSTKEKLVNQWENTNKSLNRFWEIWNREYLVSLRERSTTKHRQGRQLTRREPQPSEVVMIVDDERPRGTWKLGIIEELKKGAEGRIRTAIIRMPNKHQITRPINLLIPLEVRNCGPENNQTESKVNEKETAMDNSSWDLRTRKVPKNQKMQSAVLTPKKLPFYLLAVMLMINNLFTALVKGNPTCIPVKGNVILSIPRVKPCVSEEEDVAQRMNVTLYTQSHFKENAAFCRTIERTVCTKAFFRWSLSVVRDDTKHSSVAPQICKQLWKEKRANGISVHRVGMNVWRSQVPVEYSYGWIGTKCHTTTNFELQEDIVASEDGEVLSATYGEHLCRVHVGKCILRHTTILWNGEHMKKSCNYQEMGRYEAHVTDTRVLIEKIQASLIFLDEEKEIPEACHIKSPRVMENRMVMSIEQKHIQKRTIKKKQHPASKRKGNDVDPENPRLQYLYDRLHQEMNEHIRALHEQWCLSNNRIIRILQWISINHPTKAAQYILREEQIMAVREKGNLIITPCNSYGGTIERNYSGVVFNSFPMTNMAIEKIRLQLRTLVQQQKWEGSEATSQMGTKSAIEGWRNEAEETIEEIGKATEKVGKAIGEEIDAIANQWKLELGGLVLAVTIIIGVMVWWKCGCNGCNCQRQKWINAKVRYRQDTGVQLELGCPNGEQKNHDNPSGTAQIRQTVGRCISGDGQNSRSDNAVTIQQSMDRRIQFKPIVMSVQKGRASVASARKKRSIPNH